MFLDRYQADIAAAIERIQSVPSKTLQLPNGTVEYARRGAGPSVLMSHGIFGSHIEGLDMVDGYVGSGFDAIAPSRFGYLGSSLPDDGTPAMQADTYVALLDHLGVESVAAVGYSAGSTSVLELALRHPDRVDALVLLAANLPGASVPVGFIRPLLAGALRWQFGLWALLELAPRAYERMLGVPRGYHSSVEEQRTIDEVARSIQPVHLRSTGAVFDALVSNPAVNRCSLEALTVPTVIVHSADDTLALYEHAIAAHTRIPDCSFVTMRRGGHLFLGHSHLVEREVSVFIRQAVLHDLLV